MRKYLFLPLVLLIALALSSCKTIHPFSAPKGPGDGAYERASAPYKAKNDGPYAPTQKHKVIKVHPW